MLDASPVQKSRYTTGPKEPRRDTRGPGANRPRGHPHRPGLRFHDLRHACGSLLIAEGVKPKLVQAILRHSKLSTTMDLYVHAYDEDLRAAVGALDGALAN
jgi:integrase